MSEDDNHPAGSGDERDDSLAELKDLERETYVANFSWHLPIVILVELSRMISHILRALSGGSGGSAPGGTEQSDRKGARS
jgi:hypothetical protein